MVKQLRSENSAYLHRASNRMQEILAQKPIKTRNHSWLIVYLDVITLLLALFVLLANQPQQQFAVEEALLKKELLQQEPVESPVIELYDETSDQIAESKTPSPDLQTNLAEELRKQLEMIEGEDLVVEVEPGNISLRLPESILFETGKSDLLSLADELLNNISPILLENDFPISVEGHTDNVPIFSTQFPSNWELSSARASVVIRKLGELGVPFSRLKAIGLADTLPIDSNETDEGRRKNRRVNIIIHVTAEQ